MKKYFVVADVHGYYDELMMALHLNGFDLNNPEHIFVSCGDLLDRGRKPLQCMQFVNNLPDNRKLLIWGNHESLMCDMIHKGYTQMHDYYNGTAQTVVDCLPSSTRATVDDSLKEFNNLPDWQQYLHSLEPYAEIGNYIFVHGWIPINGDKYDPKYNDEWRILNFEDALWLNGMDMWSKGIREPNKTIVCGHWNTEWGHKHLHGKLPGSKDARTFDFYQPFIDDGIIALDTTTARSLRVNCIVLEI